MTAMMWLILGILIGRYFSVLCQWVLSMGEHGHTQQRRRRVGLDELLNLDHPVPGDHPIAVRVRDEEPNPLGWIPSQKKHRPVPHSRHRV